MISLSTRGAAPRFPFRGAIVCAALGALLTGCIPEESPVAPYDRGDAVQSEIAMGSDYRNRVYFDVETATAVRSSPIADWDLGFQCEPDSFGVVLNGAQIMAVADAGAVPFEGVTSYKELTWEYDRPSGEIDSSAIGAWWTKSQEGVATLGHVYVADRGYSHDAQPLGYAKFMIVAADAGGYTVRVGDLKNANDRTIRIARDPERSLVGLTFDNGGTVVEIEPPKGAWDILFTRYTHIFYAPELIPYSVTGVLLNRYGTAVAVDSVRKFEEITTADIGSYDLTERLDAVGYEWKSYDLQKGIYVIHSPTYILRDAGGFYYKFRFLDFYNSAGDKGYPLMESQKL